MERNSSGALRAPGAFGASGTSDPHAIISSCSLHVHHARLLAPTGSTSGGAASGRTGASGASQRGLRPHCGAAESGFEHWPAAASPAGDGGVTAPHWQPRAIVTLYQRTRASNGPLKRF
jgi:hypothetical protein